MSLPPQTAKIFEWLSKGLFINSHSANPEQEELYKAIDEHFDELKSYFEQIAFQLERGEKYFYLSRIESKTPLEDKLLKLYRYLDALDFFITYDPAFGIGSRFRIEEIVDRCKEDILLRRKLQKLDIRGDKPAEKIKRLSDMMLKEHFFDLENERENTYRVLHAFHYLETLIQSIEIDEA